MTALKLYFKLLWYFKTPFIILLDLKYKLASLAWDIPTILNLSEYGTYTKDYYDCDDYAFNLKHEANEKQLNSIGVIVGWCNGWHMWNVAVCDMGIHQIEPQNKMIFKKLKGYIPLVVIV